MKGSNVQPGLLTEQRIELHQRRASWLHTGPSLHRAGMRGATLAPDTGFLHQTVGRLIVAYHVFLGSWTVDICQEGHSLRSAHQRRHMAHLIRCSCSAPRKPSGQDLEGD